MRKPKVGDILFLVDVGNRTCGTGGKQRDCIVSKVGRKYFYIKERPDYQYEIQFYIDTRREKTEGSSNYALYENRQAWEEENEANLYRTLFRETFDYSWRRKFTLIQLKNAALALNIQLGEKEKSG